MVKYDGERFNPPAPVARVTLINPQSGQRSSGVELLIDTGADLTVLPIRAIERVGLSPDSDKSFELTAFDGRSIKAKSVTLEIKFGKGVFHGHYALTDDAYGYLGRDILNDVTLYLYGLRLEWSVEF